MNLFISHTVEMLTTSLNGIKVILLRGSQQTEDQVDLWSDIDLLIVLNPEAAVEEERFIRAVHSLGCVAGSEKHTYSEHAVLYRAAIEYNGCTHLLDAHICTYQEWLFNESGQDRLSTIIFGDIEYAEPAMAASPAASFDSYDCNTTWFKYFIAVKKFARNDHLIGLHLLLNLIQEYLVVEMIERDMKQGTSIHRFGYAEKLPDSLSLYLVDITNKRAVLDYISRLAYAYDHKLSLHLSGYASKYAQVANYIERTKLALQ